MNTKTQTPKPTITLSELMRKRPSVLDLIIGFVIVLPDKRLIVGDSYEICYERAKKWTQHMNCDDCIHGYLYSDGNVGIDKAQASKSAFTAKQTSHLCSPLKPEDIF